jgi:hypothetical protein
MKAIEERFWEKVDRRSADECWEWMAALHSTGYGVIGRGGRKDGIVRAHRLSWEIHFGPVPDGLFVLHRCDNRPCVNPRHLFVGTNQDNVDDMHAKGRDTRGEKCPWAKLTAEQVDAIRSEYVPWSRAASHTALGKKYGVSASLIGFIIGKRRWKK